jgi:hypothetical protein
MNHDILKIFFLKLVCRKLNNIKIYYDGMIWCEDTIPLCRWLCKCLNVHICKYAFIKYFEIKIFKYIYNEVVN